MMQKVKVYRFRTYDPAKDDWFVSTRMATRETIDNSKVLELIPGTKAEIDAKWIVIDGYTARNFDPKSPS
jgi:hypothetical protein